MRPDEHCRDCEDSAEAHAYRDFRMVQACGQNNWEGVQAQYETSKARVAITAGNRVAEPSCVVRRSELI